MIIQIVSQTNVFHIYCTNNNCMKLESSIKIQFGNIKFIPRFYGTMTIIHSACNTSNDANATDANNNKK